MIDISTLKEVAVERPSIFSSFEKTELSPKDIQNLDRPVYADINPRSLLEPLTEDTTKELRERGFPEPVTDAIGSEQEAKIYCDAELECTTVNGKDALVRTDIDLERKDAFGDSNLERMEKGKSPLDHDGRPFELHHIGQTADAPLAELTRAQHMSGGNDTILHDKLKESEIDRSDFAKERANHWQARAEIYQAQYAGNV